MIKAYHQVGMDSMSPEARSELLERVMNLGQLLPAVKRANREDMYEECFGEKRGVALQNRYAHAGGVALNVMREMAMEWVKQLPKGGSPHNLFTCVDVIAGDLGRLFLSIDDWYTVDNGFVFDAEDLIRRGASIREIDLLGDFDLALERVTKNSFKTKSEARKAIEGAINGVLFNRVMRGQAAIDELEDCQALRNAYEGTSGCKLIELVWDGPLPLELAIEAWDNGRRLPAPDDRHIYWP